MEDYKYVKLHCVHLGDGLGSRRLAEPRKSNFAQTERNMTDVSIKAACWGKGRAPIFLCSHLSSFSHTTLHFNGLCRKSMWDRLHRGRKRVWSSTNKHYGLTAAAPKVEISANRLTLTLFWAEGTLLRGVIQKATDMWFLIFSASLLNFTYSGETALSLSLTVRHFF